MRIRAGGASVRAKRRDGSYVLLGGVRSAAVLRGDQVKRLKELEQTNLRLRKAVSDIARASTPSSAMSS